MAISFKVWVQIEKHYESDDHNHHEFEDVDVPFGATGEFAELADAERLADMLNAIGRLPIIQLAALKAI